MNGYKNSTRTRSTSWYKLQYKLCNVDIPILSRIVPDIVSVNLYSFTVEYSPFSYSPELSRFESEVIVASALFSVPS